MNVAVRVMDWSKYTIDGWLEQFGAWCETARLKGGELPDGLHVNQIYWLIREADKTPRNSKCYIRCEISDFEAEQVQALLRGVFNSNIWHISAIVDEVMVIHYRLKLIKKMGFFYLPKSLTFLFKVIF
ncbi:hypothetical protein D3C75_580450 [compost metagenome]